MAFSGGATRDLPWPKAHGDLQNTGQGIGPPARGTVEWTFRAGHQIHGGAVVGRDGVVYIGAWDKRFYAIEPRRGKALWSFRAPGCFETPAALAPDGTVYAGTVNITDLTGVYMLEKALVLNTQWDPDQLYAIDGRNGKKRWSRWYSVVGLTVAPELGMVLFGHDPSLLVALDMHSGHKKWSLVIDRDGSVTGTPAVDANGTAYVSGRPRDLSHVWVLAVDSLKGRTLWRIRLESYLASSPVVGPAGVIYVSTRDDIFALDAKTGQQRWSSGYGGGGITPAVGHDGTVYAGLQGLTALDGRTGRPSWTFRQPVTSSIVIAGDGTVYFGTIRDGGNHPQDYGLCALDHRSGREKWFVDNVPVGGSLAIGGDGKVYGLCRGLLYAFG